MRSRLMVLVAVLLTAAVFSSSCTLMRPAVNAAGQAAEDWWKEGGKEKVTQAAKDAAKSIGEELKDETKEYVAEKIDENNKRLEALGVNPDNLKTPAGILAELKVGLKAIEDNQKKPPEQQKNLPDRTELYIAIATIVLGGHFGKGVYRRCTGQKTALKDAPPLKT